MTSYLFDLNGAFLPERLDQLVAEVGRERLVIDLSCRAKADGWVVAMNRWQNQTDLLVDAATIVELSDCCSEFLVHAADVEGANAKASMSGSWNFSEAIVQSQLPMRAVRAPLKILP